MSEQQQVSNPRRAALVALVVATAIAVAWTFWPRGEQRAEAVVVPPQTVQAGTVLNPSVCGNPATEPFRPTRISVQGVAKNAPVLALGRDARNVPQAPPISTAGKSQYGWDDPTQANRAINDTLKPPGAFPGADRGNVLLNAHTWPDGTAFGNRLMEHLDVGDRIVVRGKNAELCYRVTKKIVIRAADGSAEYYQQDGPPQIALIVCSPPRLGPGNWENRTIWFASPITA